jgi:hypothetical protein
LVLVSERTGGSLSALEDIRAEVRREWTNARRMEANEKFYQTLLQGYTVTIERPEVAQGTDQKRVAEARQ